MTPGEKSDLPGHQIYNANLDPKLAFSTNILPLLGKHSDKADDPNMSDEISRKREAGLTEGNFFYIAIDTYTTIIIYFILLVIFVNIAMRMMTPA